MNASHFITLVQNTHNEASVQPALAGVVPGIVSAAPVQSVTDPLTLPLFLRDMAFRENIYAPGPLHKLFPGSLTILQQVQGVRCSGKPSLKPFYPLNLLLCASFLFEMQLFLICFYQSTVSKYMLKTNGAKQICNSKKKKKSSPLALIHSLSQRKFHPISYFSLYLSLFC